MRQALALTLTLAAGCGKAAAPAEEPRQTLYAFKLRQTLLGSPRWDLSAERALLREDAKQAELVQPRMEFFERGRAVSRVRAESGSVQTETHDVILSSSVVLEGLQDRSRLETETMRYSSKEDLFITEAPVLVTRPEGVMRGRGLRAKPDLSEVRVFEQETRMKEAPK